jgi:hypothetical protein
VHDDVSFFVPKPLADLPWGEVPVRLRVRVRKFFYGDLVRKQEIRKKMWLLFY